MKQKRRRVVAESPPAGDRERSGSYLRAATEGDGTVLIEDVEDALAILDDDHFDLVIADPPFFKVVGQKWDYQWRTFDDYACWCERWIAETHRVLRPNGHFWLWGYFNGLAGLYSRLETVGFRFRQTVIVDKGMQLVAGRATKNYRQFPNVVEYCTNFVKWAREDLASLLLRKKEELGITAKEINEHLGVKANGGGMWSIYTGRNVCAQIPTRERWDKLRALLKIELMYEDIEVVWNPIKGLTNVWSGLTVKDRTHPTQKSAEAIRRIVTASTRDDAKVLDLFAGSLTTHRVCQELGRRCTSVERDTVRRTGAMGPRRSA